MPVQFIKSVILTILLIVQFGVTDITLTYAKNSNLPIEVALLASLGVLVLEVLMYRGATRKLLEKYQSPSH